MKKVEFTYTVSESNSSPSLEVWINGVNKYRYEKIPVSALGFVVDAFLDGLMYEEPEGEKDE